MFHLFKLITSIDNDDTLTIYIENDDYVDGVVTELGLKFENGDIKQCKKQKLKEAILKSVELLQRSSFEEIRATIDDALKLGNDNNFENKKIYNLKFKNYV